MDSVSGSHLITVGIVPPDTPAVASTVEFASSKVLLGHKLDMIELPDMIAVETRFITHQVAIEASIMGTHDLQADIKREIDESQITFHLSNSFKSVGVTASPSVADIGVITESPHPVRERGQQTEKFVIPSTSIGVQCKLDDELDFGETTQQELAEEANDKREEFKQFVEEQTYEYSNGKRECLLCGEISAHTQAMEQHVALHWGPGALCHHCGTALAHRSLLRGHRCDDDGRIVGERKKHTRRLRCPHFRCHVMAVSELELYDHLNEHARLQPYECGFCGKSFATIGELQQHHILRIRCCAIAHNYRSPYAPLLKQQQRLYRMRIYMAYTQRKKRLLVKRRLTAILRWDRKVRHCQICMRRCNGGRRFIQHVKKCLKAFIARRKEEEPPLPRPATPNGILSAGVLQVVRGLLRYAEVKNIESQNIEDENVEK